MSAKVETFREKIVPIVAKILKTYKDENEQVTNRALIIEFNKMQVSNELKQSALRIWSNEVGLQKRKRLRQAVFKIENQMSLFK